ncbi:MAG: hypothetical protein ACRCU5_05530 [Rhizobiaceae bacterium]
MKRFLTFSLAVLFSGSLLAHAQQAGDNPLLMTNPQISATFPGMTMVGKYADGTNFRETYHKDGSVTYWDEVSVDKGRWFVRGNLFCTFYEASDGACFSVQKTSTNCYEYLVEEDEDGTKNAVPGAWNSIGWDEEKPSTCDLTPKTA